MLNTMRRNLKSLSWVLWLTVASFVIAIFAVWGGAGGAGGTSANWMAKVNGEPVSVVQFQNAYRNLDGFYRQIYQQNYDARALGVARQALDQLIRDKLILDEARRLGLQTSSREISRAITRNPSFQVDGRFIGVQQYKKLLHDRGIDVAGYERSVGQDLLSAKYRRLITDSVTVSSEEVLDDYRSRNEKVQVDYILLRTEEIETGITVDDADLKGFFESRREEYRTPERRGASYVLINAERLGGPEPVTDEEARAYYDDNLSRLYSRPAQVRASQILLNVAPTATPEEEGEARTRGEDLLLRLRAGEDFADLAGRYSEHSSQTLGGDMGFFGAGSMRPEFEDAAFSMAVGDTSDLVRTDLGFHLIRVTDRREASLQAFSEVRDSILRQLEFSRSQEAVSGAVALFRDEVQADPAQFHAAAQRLGLGVEETGLVSADGDVESLGAFPQVAASLFQLQVGQVSLPVTLPQGTVFLQASEVRPPEPMPFDQARSRVEPDYRREQALETVRRQVEDTLASGADLAGLASELGATVESTVEFTRRQPVDPLTAEARRAAFVAPVGDVAMPVEVPEGLLVFSVIDHQEVDPIQFVQAEDNLRRSLVQRRRNLLFNTVVDHLQAQSQIQVNQALLDRFQGRGT
jgi:peptidyl-prolyl cis-trans isomerase D